LQELTSLQSQQQIILNHAKDKLEKTDNRSDGHASAEKEVAMHAARLFQYGQEITDIVRQISQFAMNHSSSVDNHSSAVLSAGKVADFQTLSLIYQIEWFLKELSDRGAEFRVLFCQDTKKLWHGAGRLARDLVEAHVTNNTSASCDVVANYTDLPALITKNRPAFFMCKVGWKVDGGHAASSGELAYPLSSMTACGLHSPLLALYVRSMSMQIISDVNVGVVVDLQLISKSNSLVFVDESDFTGFSLYAPSFYDAFAQARVLELVAAESDAMTSVSTVALDSCEVPALRPRLQLALESLASLFEDADGALSASTPETIVFLAKVFLLHTCLCSVLPLNFRSQNVAQFISETVRESNLQSFVNVISAHLAASIRKAADDFVDNPKGEQTGNMLVMCDTLDGRMMQVILLFIGVCATENGGACIDTCELSLDLLCGDRAPGDSRPSLPTSNCNWRSAIECLEQCWPGFVTALQASSTAAASLVKSSATFFPMIVPAQALTSKPALAELQEFVGLQTTIAEASTKTSWNTLKDVPFLKRLQADVASCSFEEDLFGEAVDDYVAHADNELYKGSAEYFSGDAPVFLDTDAHELFKGLEDPAKSNKNESWHDTKARERDALAKRMRQQSLSKTMSRKTLIPSGASGSLRAVPRDAKPTQKPQSKKPKPLKKKDKAKQDKANKDARGEVKLIQAAYNKQADSLRKALTKQNEPNFDEILNSAQNEFKRLLDKYPKSIDRFVPTFWALDLKIYLSAWRHSYAPSARVAIGKGAQNSMIRGNGRFVDATLDRCATRAATMLALALKSMRLLEDEEARLLVQVKELCTLKILSVITFDVIGFGDLDYVAQAPRDLREFKEAATKYGFENGIQQHWASGLDVVKFQMRYCGAQMPRQVGTPDEKERVTFVPDDWQKDLLDAIDEDKSALVVAPTSAGKTFAAYYALRKVLEADDEGVLVYVCPSLALALQTSAEIPCMYEKENYHNSGRTMTGLFVGSVRRGFRDCQLLVTVPQDFLTLFTSPKHQHIVKKVLLPSSSSFLSFLSVLPVFSFPLLLSYLLLLPPLCFLLVLPCVPSPPPPPPPLTCLPSFYPSLNVSYLPPHLLFLGPVRRVRRVPQPVRATRRHLGDDGRLDPFSIFGPIRHHREPPSSRGMAQAHAEEQGQRCEVHSVLGQRHANRAIQ
jgi:hypothetical protein